MNATRILAIVLIVGGILGLIYGGFTYTKDSHDAEVGGLELSLEEKDSVHVPIWLSVGALVVGGALLVFPRKRI